MPRPKGSKNKRTMGIPQHLAEQLGHRDPADVLAEVYSMDHKQLQKLVRSAAGARAMAIKVQAATAAMPYRHSKMPVAVTVTEDRLPTLVIDSRQHQMQQNQQLMREASKGLALLPLAQDVQTIEQKGENDDQPAD